MVATSSSLYKKYALSIDVIIKETQIYLFRVFSMSYKSKIEFDKEK